MGDEWRKKKHIYIYIFYQDYWESGYFSPFSFRVLGSSSPSSSLLLLHQTRSLWWFGGWFSDPIHFGLAFFFIVRDWVHDLVFKGKFHVLDLFNNNHLVIMLKRGSNCTDWSTIKMEEQSRLNPLSPSQGFIFILL